MNLFYADYERDAENSMLIFLFGLAGRAVSGRKNRISPSDLTSLLLTGNPKNMDVVGMILIRCVAHFFPSIDFTGMSAG